MTVEAWDREEAESKIYNIGWQELKAKGCPPMIMTYHLHVRDLREGSKNRY